MCVSPCERSSLLALVCFSLFVLPCQLSVCAFLGLHLSGGLHLPMLLCVLCTLLAVPSWRGWSHDLTEGRPSAAPGNCLQEKERKMEKRECRAELKMRGVVGEWERVLWERNRGWEVCACGGVLER